MRCIKRRRLWASIALFAVICFGYLPYSFARGMLFPLSPVVIGFEHRDLTRARIYYHDGADVALLNNIDGLIARVEERHGMAFPEQVEVFMCGSDEEYRRLASTGSRFCATPPYGRLFISKRAQSEALEGAIHLDVYLTHELSHCLLFQHTSLISALRCPDWLLEGLAVLNAGQMGVDGYNTRDEVREKMRRGYFLSPGDFIVKPWGRNHALKAFALPDKYWFLYSEMACLVDDLIQTHGKERFRGFLDAVLAGESANAAYEAVYGGSFQAFVESFRARMAGAPPRGALS